MANQFFIDPVICQTLKAEVISDSIKPSANSIIFSGEDVKLAGGVLSYRLLEPLSLPRPLEWISYRFERIEV